MRSITAGLHRGLLSTVFVCTLLLGVLEGAGHALGRDVVADSPLNFLRYVLPAAFAVVHATWVLGARRGLCFVLALFLVGFVAEVIGLRYGILFGGPYSYRGDAPTLFGVPLLVPIFWAIFIYGGYSLTTSLLHWMGKEKPGVRAGDAPLLPVLVTLDGLIVVAIDIILDPVAARVQMWSWPGGGAFFGVPIGNFVGWFAVAAVSTGAFRVFEYACPARSVDSRSWAQLMPPVCYVVVCVILTLWAVRVGLASVALVGLLVMGLVPAAGLIVLSFFTTPQQHRARTSRQLS